MLVVGFMGVVMIEVLMVKMVLMMMVSGYSGDDDGNGDIIKVLQIWGSTFLKNCRC